MSTRVLVSIKEAAHMLSMTPWQVYTTAKEGQIPYGHVERRMLVRVSDVEAYAGKVVSSS